MGTTTNYGWEYPDNGGDVDNWGVILTTLFGSIDGRVKTNQTAAEATAAVLAAFVGMEGNFYSGVAPAGWVKANGGTIGNAASGATTRANADTANLFAFLWTNLDNTNFPIQTSSGVPTTRGGSAAADYAANYRLPLPDRRSNVARGFDDGRGVDPGRAIGVEQLDAMQGHYHSVGPTPTVGTGGGYSGTAGVSGVSTTQTGSPITDGASGTPRTASETRMRNLNPMVCIKL